MKVEASDKTGEASTSTEFKISDEIADCKDNAFRQFRRVAADVAEESSYLEKSKIINTFLTKGSCGSMCNVLCRSYEIELNKYKTTYQ